MNLWITEVRGQFLDELIGDSAPHLDAHRPLVKQLLGRFHEAILETGLQCRVALIPQKYRVSYVTFVVRISVGKHRQAERVEHFDGAHVYASAVDAGEIERKEV